MMLATFGGLLFKYLILYLYLFLTGKTTIFLIDSLRKKKLKEDYLLFTKIEILYPLIGIIFIGNLLFLLNTFFPLENLIVSFALFLCIVPASIDIFKNKNILSHIELVNIYNIFCYLVIPSILVISTFDINFNYDAGYYHLLHQNWLRSSNLIVGMVNIFWPLGMSSIYEYISAVLWFDKSFVLLHFLNLYFIHFFYLFISSNLFNSKNKYLFNSSIFILTFSLLDNFGIGGGRNGFLYIQGVTKQDVTVGILFFYLAMVMILKIKEKNIKNSELVLISFILLFVYQIKVSGVLIFYLFIILLFFQIRESRNSISEIIKLIFPAVILGTLWIIKSLYTTGCLIYPVNITCYEGFDWYIKNSTISFEAITKEASLAFDNSISFVKWATTEGSFEYRNQVFSNFIFSFAAIVFIKILLFKREKNTASVIFPIVSFIFFSYLYLIFFGPIPRYAVGICMVTIGFLGIFSSEIKLNISELSKYFIVFVSVLFIVRMTAYSAFINNENFRLFDPRDNYEINTEIGFERYSENWVTPLDKDQCWSNIECTPSKVEIKFLEEGIFKVAYRNTG